VTKAESIFDERSRKIYPFCEAWDNKQRLKDSTGACAPAIKDYAPWVERHASYEPWIAFSSNWMLSKIERVENASNANGFPGCGNVRQGQHLKIMHRFDPEDHETKKPEVSPVFPIFFLSNQ
jgi:hypothetical protein